MLVTSSRVYRSQVEDFHKRQGQYKVWTQIRFLAKLYLIEEELMNVYKGCNLKETLYYIMESRALSRKD